MQIRIRIFLRNCIIRNAIRCLVADRAHQRIWRGSLEQHELAGWCVCVGCVSSVASKTRFFCFIQIFTLHFIGSQKIRQTFSPLQEHLMRGDALTDTDCRYFVVAFSFCVCSTPIHGDPY